MVNIVEELRSPFRYDYFFIYNVWGHFFRSVLDYYGDHVFPRFKNDGTKVMATYDKAVEYLLNINRLDDREEDRPNLPAITLNPSGEMTIADEGGRQQWRYPNLLPGFGARIYQSIYDDSNVRISPVFGRFSGDIELIMWTNSIYEYLDLKTLFFEIHGGMERYIYPFYFTTFIIIPEELVNFQYSNSITGESYTLRWDETTANPELIKAINKDKLVYPGVIKPRWRLTSLSDGSERYGGTDRVAEYRLNATLNYEIEIPTFLVLKSDSGPVEEITTEIGLEITVTDDPQVYVDLVTDSTQTIQTYYEFRRNYIYEVTQQDIDSTGDIIINLPEPVENMKIVVTSLDRRMSFFDHYLVFATQVQIKKENVILEPGQLIFVTYLQEIKDLE